MPHDSCKLLKGIVFQAFWLLLSFKVGYSQNFKLAAGPQDRVVEGLNLVSFQIPESRKKMGGRTLYEHLTRRRNTCGVNM